jgi:large repetitive protein
MANHPRLWATSAVLWLSAATVGCGANSPAAPSGATATFGVTDISPNAGPTDGTASVDILGRGFQPGATVTIGGVPSSATVSSATLIVVAVPPHVEGVVDVVVTNPDGQRGTLGAGYRYLAPPPPVTVTSLSPTTGSTEGRTPLIVSGTGFQRGTIVTLGGMPTNAVFYEDSLYIVTEPHAAGPVDMMVMSPGGPAITVAAAYTYAPASAFDFNGDWEGGTGPEWGTPVRFTIANNLLVSLSCGSSGNRVPSVTAGTALGAFTLLDSGMVIATGRITSAGHAVGTVNLAPCGSDSWFARRVP